MAASVIIAVIAVMPLWHWASLLSPSCLITVMALATHAVISLSTMLAVVAVNVHGVNAWLWSLALAIIS